MVDGRRLDAVSATGKNLLLAFDGGVTLRSHLLMSGRWRVEPAAKPLRGKPWLVLLAGPWRASQWNGPILETGPTARFRSLQGLDVLEPRTDTAAIVARLRAGDQSRSVGEALVDQRVVAGIGNLWLAELLWEVGVSPRAKLRAVPNDTLTSGIDWARNAMAASVVERRPSARVYRRTGRPCPRCGTAIVSFSHGENARTMYVCPQCQAER